MSRRTLSMSLPLLLGACSGGVSGVVVDGDDFQPVPHARVALESASWGFLDGQLVWDAPKLERAESDANGQFRFNGDGGASLTVEGPDHEIVRARLCPQSSRVFIGGPHPGVTASDVLLLPGSEGALSHDMIAELGGKYDAEMLGVKVSGNALDSGEGTLRIEATGGQRLAFVSGTGNIPTAPRAEHVGRLSLKVPQDCGWAFVIENGRATGVIEISQPGRTQTTSGFTAATLQYAALR